jgi:hypothetical protein
MGGCLLPMYNWKLVTMIYQEFKQIFGCLRAASSSKQRYKRGSTLDLATFYPSVIPRYIHIIYIASDP